MAMKRGHFFSINPAMTWSKKGRTIIEQIPRDRALTESDGPFIDVESRQRREKYSDAKLSPPDGTLKETERCRLKSMQGCVRIMNDF
jgi:Tat protein secretion system quality control protein TatD with DNase activity